MAEHEQRAQPDPHEAAPPPAPPARRYTLTHLLAVAGVMLAVAVLVNWHNIAQIVAGERSVRGILLGKPDGAYEMDMQAFKFPGPLGPEDAKVHVLVVCQEGNSCHSPLYHLWMGMAELEPERIRIEWTQGGPAGIAPHSGPAHGGPAAAGAAPSDAAGSGQTAAGESAAAAGQSPGDQPPDDASARGEEEGAAADQPPGPVVDLGCEAGFTVNGEFEFDVGHGATARKVYFTGPMPGPTGHGWSHEDVALIVNGIIEEQYGEAGTLTGEIVQDAMEQAMQKAASATPVGAPGDAPGDAPTEGSAAEVSTAG